MCVCAHTSHTKKLIVQLEETNVSSRSALGAKESWVSADPLSSWRLRLRPRPSWRMLHPLPGASILLFLRMLHAPCWFSPLLSLLFSSGLGLHGLCLEDARVRISVAHVSPSIGHGFVILQSSLLRNVSQSDSPNLLKAF